MFTAYRIMIVPRSGRSMMSIHASASARRPVSSNTSLKSACCNDSLGLTLPPGSVHSFWPAVWRTSKTRDSGSSTQAITDTSLQGRSRFTFVLVLVFCNLSLFLAIKELYDASMVYSDPAVKRFYAVHSNVHPHCGQREAGHTFVQVREHLLTGCPHTYRAGALQHRLQALKTDFGAAKQRRSKRRKTDRRFVMLIG